MKMIMSTPKKTPQKEMAEKENVEEFYANDVVYRFDKRKRVIFGIVTESYEASSDVDDFDNLEKGEIRVWWSTSSREQIWRQSKVKLLNRSILPGDIVRRIIQGQETQRGYCKSAKQLVSLQIVGTDKVIEKVCCTRLKPVSKLTFGRIVCLDNKCGRIQNVYYNIIMQAKCGSSVELTKCSSTRASLDDFWLAKRNRWYAGAYYPGQEVICVPQYLHNALWIHRSKTMKRRMQCRMRFTIQTVEIESVDLVWYTTDSAQEVDKCSVKGEDIKKLKALDTMDCHILDLADRLFLRLSSSDKLLKKQDWLRKQTAMLRPETYKVSAQKHPLNRSGRYRISSTSIPTSPPAPVSDSEEWWTDDGISDHGSSSSFASSGKRPKQKHWPPRPREIVPGNTLAVEVLCFESKFTVVWQDGSIEEDIPSTQLYYSVSLDDHEFFPGEWVVGEGNQNGDEYGAIQSVNHLERTAKVKWFRINDKPEAHCDPVYLNTSEISVYDLQKQQKYQFRPGSVVYTTQKTTPNPENKIGHVIDSFPEGYILVHWMDCTESKCWPQDLMLLPEAEYDIVTETSTEYPPGSWETESEISIEGDNGQDDMAIALIATKLDFIRNKMVYLKDVFKQNCPADNIMHMRDLLIMYDNSSYLDKLLGTSFFNRKSYHFKILLEQVQNRAKEQGIELIGRLFQQTGDAPLPSLKIKDAEKENMAKVMDLETKVNAQISQSQSTESFASVSIDPEHSNLSDSNLCLELLTMLKMRMDLAYGEIASRLGFPDALTSMTKATEGTPAPTVPTTPEEVFEKPLKLIRQKSTEEGFTILDEAPKSHHFYSTIIPNNISSFYKAVRRESKLLAESLPPGVWVRGFSDRLDLLSVMIRGPSKTPYEDGLFLFDLQLGSDYPHSPPMCHFISFTSERLNPNLYVEGKVCVSLLGTWMGKGSEVWGPSSSLLQLIVSIQGLILVSEPYYNEAGYEKQVESQQGYENSRTYNELVILKLVQAMTVMSISPPEVFKDEIMNHFAQNGKSFCERIEKWTVKDNPHCPDFPLLPVSKGFLLSLQCALASFKEITGNVLEEYHKMKETSTEV